MYLRFEPTLNSGDLQEDLYQAYGLGTWLDTRLPPAKKQHPSVGMTVPTPSAFPSQPNTDPTNAIRASVMSRATPAVTLSQDNRTVDETKVISKTNGSSLLAYRHPEEDSSDEDEVPNGKDLNEPSPARGIEQEDEDDMDPTAAYVTAKLRLTSLERKLGLASKSSKKGGKCKPKANGSAPNPAEMQEYGRLDARIKACQYLSFLLVQSLLYEG